MVFTSADGIALHYERHGNSGEPLVFVHGFTGDVSDWEHQVAAFAATHRVLVLDNRGHGRSAAPEDPRVYTVERMADDVVALAAHVGFRRYHLVGHSMGGAVAQEIALRWPERLLSLTLEDTTFSFASHEPRMPERPPALPPERLEKVMARLSRMSPEVLRACWHALVAWAGTEDRAAGIRTPTLIVWGDADAPAIVEGSRRLAELIAGAEVCVLAGAGHSPQEEKPGEYNAALRAFLARGPRRP